MTRLHECAVITGAIAGAHIQSMRQLACAPQIVFMGQNDIMELSEMLAHAVVSFQGMHCRTLAREEHISPLVMLACDGGLPF